MASLTGTLGGLARCFGGTLAIGAPDQGALGVPGCHPSGQRSRSRPRQITAIASCGT
ncbi:MAG TPA: hypothetical protein VMK13_08850 [Streptosporangiaceae bacterium]|nr:hypothetical protein [Streptosporangiaceae bacterium]